MPTNKNAMIRYEILDDLFQNRQRPLPVQRLLTTVNDRLKDQGLEPIGLRALQKDIKFLRENDPWFAPIVQVEVVDDDPDHGTKKISKAYCYEEAGFSIFHKDLSHDEKQLLKAALAMLGQFDGIPQLEGLKRLVDGTKNIVSNQIVSIERNPEDDTTLLGELYLAVSDKCAINLHYHTYANPEEEKIIGFNPYLLKQYNRRWYLIGAAALDGKILTFCLDRINRVERNPNRQYLAPKEDLRERYDEIIGVTFYEEEEPVTVTFWVSDKSKDYISSKPIHDFQTPIKRDVEELRSKYPMLKDGAFFKLEVRYNYELIRELCSYGPDLVVLSPERIQSAVVDWIKSMNNMYQSLRT